MIDPQDRGFLLGDGVFETLLVVNGVALWRDEHLTRMKKAARKLDLPFERDAIDAEISATLMHARDVHVLRVMLTRGVTTRGLAADCVAPTIHVTCDGFDVGLIGKPVRLATSSVRRNPACVTDRHKTTSYANNVFAAREAKTRGADDALLLNQDGLVACTSMANVFMLRDKVLVTPPEQDGVLPGIMRRAILELAPALGFAAEVRSIEPDELQDGEQVLVSNSLRLASPVLSLDGEALGKGDMTAIQSALHDAIAAQCGRDLRSELA